MKKSILLKIMVICGLMALLHSSCGQRYWFRSKVNVDKDTTQAEKQYHIIW